MFSTAIKFILFDRAKSIGALMGIVISLFLIGQQSGIFLYLTGAMKSLIVNTKTDLWVVDNRTVNVNALAPIDVRKMREISTIPGVKQVHPIVITGGSARFPDGTSANVQIIGSQSPTFKAVPNKFIVGNKQSLIPDGAMCFDFYDTKALGNAVPGTVFEISGKRVQLAAQTKGVRGFGAVYMFTTLERAQVLGNLSNTKISAILVDLLPGVDPLTVKNAINKKIFGVQAWLPKDFEAATVKKVLSSSGIAISFGTLIVFAIISGFFIIGLTLYSSAIDRIKDYGTLKAIGASNGYVARLILLQAVIFSIVGFGIGYSLIELFRKGISNTGAIFEFDWTIRGVFLLVTLIISIGGSSFAIRRINGVEPASVFRG